MLGSRNAERVARSIEICQKYLRINFQPFGCLLTIHLCDNTCTALCHRIGLIGPINCSTPKWVWHTCVLLHDINYLRKNEKLMIDWLIDWLIDWFFFPMCCTWIAQATFSMAFPELWEQNQLWKNSGTTNKWCLHGLLFWYLQICCS